MSTEDKTMGELVADMKDGMPLTWAQVNSAWTAEREALLKRARDNYAAGFAKGKEAAERQPGNAAALREALSDACYAMFDFLKTQDGPCYREMTEALDKGKAALADPPRNCDKYANHNEAMQAFDAFVREQGKLGFINPYTEGFKWLFALATEPEGENDEQK